jgi:tetratricopeptide (TPR) repeat protein
MTLMQKGDMDGAVDHLHQAIGSSKKNFPDAHLALGIALFKKGDKEGGLKEIDQAISQSDKNATAHNTKGDMLANDGKWKEALSEYEKAIKDDAKFAAAYAGKGTAHLQLGDIDNARTAFSKAKELNPQDKNVVYTLALLLEKQGNISEAINEFENAIASENDPQAAQQIRMHINQLKQQSGMSVDVQPGVITGPSLLDNINSRGLFGH